MIAILVFANWGNRRNRDSGTSFAVRAHNIILGGGSPRSSFSGTEWPGGRCPRRAPWPFLDTFSRTSHIPFAARPSVFSHKSTDRGRAETGSPPPGLATICAPFRRASGRFLRRPGVEGIIPLQWVATLVGGNSCGLIFLPVRAFMYFAPYGGADRTGAYRKAWARPCARVASRRRLLTAQHVGHPELPGPARRLYSALSW